MVNIKILILIAALFLSTSTAYSETKPISIEFKLLCSDPSPGCEKMQISDSKDTLYLQKETQFSLVDLKDAQIKAHRYWEAPKEGTVLLPKRVCSILLTFTSKASKKFAQVTSDNVGKRLGIVIDGKLVMAPVIREPIRSGEISIDGATTEASAADIVERIKNALGVSLGAKFEEGDLEFLDKFKKASGRDQ